MSFGGIKNTRLTREEQKRIHYLCMSYKQMMPNLRRRMIGLCDLIGGKHSAALFDVLTNKYKTVKEIAGKHLTNEKELYRLRKMFFERFSAVLDEESNIKYINKTEDEKMGFTYLKNCNLSVNEQRWVHYICLNYDMLPEQLQEKLINLCKEIGKKEADLLFKAVTNPYSKKKMYNLRAVLFERFHEECKEYFPT